jgi:FkbM family methyltransferase
MLNLVANTPYKKIFEDHQICAFDIGARGGIASDLLPIAKSVNAIGFEPDEVAYAVLNTKRSPWKSLRYLPSGISAKNGAQILHITEDPQSSTLMIPDEQIGNHFKNNQFFNVIEKKNVEVMTLDSAVSFYNTPYPEYLKIDIEGPELDVLQASPLSMQHLLAIRIEVAFIPFRHNQPLADQVHAFLYNAGFDLVDIDSMHKWRIGNSVAHPFLDKKNDMPYSKGQIVQSDYVYLRRLNTILSLENKIKLGLIAAALGYYDMSSHILLQQEINQTIRDKYQINVETMLNQLSKKHGKYNLKESLYKHLRLIYTHLKSIIFSH